MVYNLYIVEWFHLRTLTTFSSPVHDCQYEELDTSQKESSTHRGFRYLTEFL